MNHPVVKWVVRRTTHFRVRLSFFSSRPRAPRDRAAPARQQARRPAHHLLALHRHAHPRLPHLPLQAHLAGVLRLGRQVQGQVRRDKGRLQLTFGEPGNTVLHSVASYGLSSDAYLYFFRRMLQIGYVTIIGWLVYFLLLLRHLLRNVFSCSPKCLLLLWTWCDVFHRRIISGIQFSL